MKPKELYLGSCVQDLNVMAEKLDKNTSPKIYLKSMLKIVEGAQKAEQEGDQEKAYVLFMRYCSIFQLIIRSREYSIHKTYYDSMLNRGQIETAMNRIEELQKKLNTRFEEREAKQLLAKRDEERKKEVAARIEAAPGPPSPLPDPPTAPAQPWLSPTTFVHQLRSPKPPLVFDLRPKADAEAFPLKAEAVICLDPSSVPQSATVRHISQALNTDPAALARFERRAEAPRVVLMDENSKPPLTGVLKRVKEALFEWDASQQLKEEPLSVEGGFENFFHLFPTLVANAQKYREVLKERDLKARSKDEVEIHYPDLEERNRRKREEAAEAERKQHEAAMEADRKRQEEAMEAARRRREEAAEAERLREEAMEADRKRQVAEMQAARKRRQTEATAAEAERGAMTSRLQAEKERNKEKQRQLNGEPAPPDRALKPEKSASPKPAAENSVADSKTASSNADKTAPTEEKKTAPSVNEKSTKEKKKTDPRKSSANAETTDASKSSKESKPAHSGLGKPAAKDTTSAADGSEKSTKEPKTAAVGPEKSAKESKKSHGSDKPAKESKAPPSGPEKSAKDTELSHVEPDKSKDKASFDQKGTEASKEPTDRPSSKKTADGHKASKKSILKDSPERKDPPKENRTDLRRPKPSDVTQGDDRAIPMVNRALKPSHANNHNEAKSTASVSPSLVANEQQYPSPKQWAVKGGARIQAPQQQQHPQQQQQPEAAGAAASSWERRVDAATGREYFVDLTTLATRWSDGSSRPPQHPTHRVTKMPLKDEPWSSSGGSKGSASGATSSGGARLKRSGSQPNLAVSSRDDSATDTDSPSSSFTSRGAVGGEMGASAVASAAAASSSGHRPLMPSRDSKPRNFNETDLSAFDSETLRLMYAEYGTTEGGLTGLRNLGNSCYMNSVVQALSNTPCLVRYIVTNNYRSDINRSNPAGHGGEIADEFATLLRALWAGRYRIISPMKFKRTVGRKNSMFATNEQQDSQEFLLFLLDGLHEDFNAGESRRGAPSPPAVLEDEKAPLKERAREAWRWHERFNRSFVVSFFQGQFRSTVRCLTCNMTSTTFDVFMYLSLQIPSHSRCSLRDCISQFSKDEHMSGSSQWHCPRCRQNRDAVKNLTIWRLPPYLLIHLKRFSFEQSLRAKMNTLVDFPLQDLQIEQQSGEASTYDLYAVSNHYGSMESGHYTAYCLNPGLWKWFKFDDDAVSPIGEHHIRTSAAYILFYATKRGGMGHNSWFE